VEKLSSLGPGICQSRGSHASNNEDLKKRDISFVSSTHSILTGRESLIGLRLK
jgi:hypothetical protein